MTSTPPTGSPPPIAETSMNGLTIDGASVIISPTDEEPSSFSRVPLDNNTLDNDQQSNLLEGAEGTDSFMGGKKRKRKATASSAGTSPTKTNSADSDATRANLAAASVVGVVGYGPGTGGGSGIKRHTPSCDFCKRRKERCSGGPPCQTCANRAIPCTFETVNKAHFLRKKPKLPASTDGADLIASLTNAGEGVGDELELTDAVGKPPRIFKKRGKVSEIACTFCRDRRKKCSAEKPTCANCFKRGVECIYPDSPRQRRGGRRKKDTGESSASAAPDNLMADDHGASSRMAGLTALAGLTMPMFQNIPCHHCKDHNVNCDRTFPTCLNCHQRAVACTYDAPEASQSTINPAALHPLLLQSSLLRTSIAQSAQSKIAQNPVLSGLNPSLASILAAQQVAAFAAVGQLPYYDLSWLTHLTELQAQASGSSAPQTATAPSPTTISPAVAGLGSVIPGFPFFGFPMNLLPTQPTQPNQSLGKDGQPSTMPGFMYPPIYDPAITAAAFAQAAAQVQAPSVTTNVNRPDSNVGVQPLQTLREQPLPNGEDVAAGVGKSEEITDLGGNDPEEPHGGEDAEGEVDDADNGQVQSAK
ncbi:hypothetical protein FRC02_011876 [Tulasnella sp. 418]|nr:hypothetical protein FRC02_011876 [Tulasnella sp. 418]